MAVSLAHDPSNYTAQDAPIALATEQTVSPNFFDDTGGLIGLAFPALSQFPTEPKTLFDAWVSRAGGSIKNQIGFYGCPYSLIEQSWIDFGNTEPMNDTYSSFVKATAQSPALDFYNIDIRGILLGESRLSLPTSFQRGSYSIVDSCTTVILLPSKIANSFQKRILNSGGFDSLQLTDSMLISFILGEITVLCPSSVFKWELLPSLTFGNLFY